MTEPKDEMDAKENELVIEAFARLHKTALGVAVGAVCGGALWAATLWLLIKGGEAIGRTLSLLGEYFPGYSVTPTGAMVGFLYGFGAGFLIGWTIALVWNLLLRLFLLEVKGEAELEEASRLMDRW